MPGSHGDFVHDVAQLALGGVVGPRRASAHPERDPVAADPSQAPGHRDVCDDEQDDPGDHPDDQDPGDRLDGARVAIDEPIEEAPDRAPEIRGRHDEVHQVRDDDRERQQDRRQVDPERDPHRGRRKGRRDGPQPRAPSMVPLGAIEGLAVG